MKQRPGLEQLDVRLLIIYEWNGGGICLDICRNFHHAEGMASVPRTPDLSVEEALGVTEVAHILGVHPRTIERRRGARKTPRPLEAQREEKLHRIWRELTNLFTPENAIYWLRHPVPVLEDRRPVAVMAEDGGLDRVLEVVGRMSWGSPA